RALHAKAFAAQKAAEARIKPGPDFQKAIDRKNALIPRENKLAAIARTATTRAIEHAKAAGPKAPKLTKTQQATEAKAKAADRARAEFQASQKVRQDRIDAASMGRVAPEQRSGLSERVQPV